jgi:bifunctional isochorismate lyase/aryl carrier protein
MVKRAMEYVTVQNVDERGRHWAAEVRGQVRPRPHLRLVPSRAALLVIDMVRYFGHPSGDAYLPASAAVIWQLRRLLPVWRRAGGRIVATRHGHDGPHDAGMLGRFFMDTIPWDSPASGLLPELPLEPGDMIIRKRTYDALHDTGLAGQLREMGCSQVLVAGLLTHMCCATTARSAFVHGFETHFLVDATATTNETLHQAALLTLADSVAICHTTREVLDQCLLT